MVSWVLWLYKELPMKFAVSKYGWGCVIAGILVLGLPRQAHAYIGPVTITVAMNVIVAVCVGGFWVARVHVASLYHKVLSILGKEIEPPA